MKKKKKKKLALELTALLGLRGTQNASQKTACCERQLSRWRTGRSQGDDEGRATREVSGYGTLLNPNRRGSCPGLRTEEQSTAPSAARWFQGPPFPAPRHYARWRHWRNHSWVSPLSHPTPHPHLPVQLSVDSVIISRQKGI